MATFGVDEAYAPVKAQTFSADEAYAPPTKERGNATANTAALTLSGAAQGLEHGMNPLSLAGDAASMLANRFVRGIINPAGIATEMASARAREVAGRPPEANPAEDFAKWAQRNAPATSPMRIAGPAADYIAGKLTTPRLSAAEAIDPEKVYAATGATRTPLRENLIGGAGIAGSMLSPAGLAMGGTPGLAVKSGLGAAGLGYGAESLTGSPEVGKWARLAGAIAGPLAYDAGRGAIARMNTPKPPEPPGVPTPQEASERLAKAISDTYQSEKGIVKPEIQAGKETVRSAAMPTNVVRGYSDKYLASVGPVEASTIPTGRLEAALTGQRVDFREVDNALSIMKAEARQLPRLDPRRLAIEKYVGYMSDLAPYKQPGVQGAYSQYAQFKSEFGNRYLGNIFKIDKTGQPMIPPERMGEAIAKLPAEGIQYLRSYPKIAEAMDAYRQSANLDLLEKAVEQAGTRSGSYVGANFDKAVRVEFRKLSTPNQIAQFPPEVQDAIRNVVNGEGIRNTIAWLGKFSPQGYLPFMGHLAVAAFNPTLGAAGALTGLGSRAIANNMARTAATSAIDVVKRGYALPPIPPLLPRSALRDAMLGGAAARQLERR